MQPIDRYLKAVRQLLPQGQRDDIINELSDNILSQMEDRESALGRPLTEAEQTTILTQHGDPMTVAARYQTNQGSFVFGTQIIGPVLFPFYRQVLALNLAVTLLACIVIGIVRNLVGSPSSVFDIIGAIIAQFALQFSIVTAIFAYADRQPGMFNTDWLNGLPDLTRTPKREGTGQIRFEAVVELIALGIFAWWLVSVGTTPQIDLGPTGITLTLGPIWQQTFLPLLLLTIAGIAQAVITFARPDWERFRHLARIASTAVWVVIGYFIAVAGNWIVAISGTGDTPADVQRLVDGLNWWLPYGIGITVAISVVMLLVYIWQFIRSEQRRNAEA